MTDPMDAAREAHRKQQAEATSRADQARGQAEGMATANIGIWLRTILGADPSVDHMALLTGDVSDLSGVPGVHFKYGSGEFISVGGDEPHLLIVATCKTGKHVNRQRVEDLASVGAVLAAQESPCVACSRGQ